MTQSLDIRIVELLYPIKVQALVNHVIHVVRHRTVYAEFVVSENHQETLEIDVILCKNTLLLLGLP